MNWGRVFGWTIATLSFGASIGYLFAKNYRLSLYWFFATCITVVVNWP